jgi:hypothetical protein
MNNYQITESTKNILKNFANINNSILLKEGHVQKTVSASKSILAIATFADPWPQDTPVYQLPELLANITSYDQPRLTFEEKQFVIQSASSPSHVEYPYSDPSVILAAPDKDLPITNPQASFTLPDAAVKEIKKFASINSLPTVTIDVDGGARTIVVKPLDDKNPTSRVYSYPVHSDVKNIESLDTTGTLQVKIKREHFDLIMDGSYTVSVGAWPYVYLQHKTEPVAYFIVQKS